MTRVAQLNEYATQVAEGLERRGLFERPLFEALARKRPGHRKKIMALAPVARIT